jgi:hypothetical protein
MDDDRYWFPAKRYGWGWGLPQAWQGWLVLLGFVLLVALGTLVFPPSREPVAYLGYVIVLCGVLVGICYLKGEPPRWRWGDDRK